MLLSKQSSPEGKPLSQVMNCLSTARPTRILFQWQAVLDSYEMRRTVCVGLSDSNIPTVAEAEIHQVALAEIKKKKKTTKKPPSNKNGKNDSFITITIFVFVRVGGWVGGWVGGGLFFGSFSLFSFSLSFFLSFFLSVFLSFCVGWLAC